MTTGATAKRATVAIGPLSVDGFQMPDGSYRRSITGAADLLGLTARNAFDFLPSKAADRFLCKVYAGSAFGGVARLKQQLRDAGLEPWQPPQTER